MDTPRIPDLGTTVSLEIPVDSTTSYVKALDTRKRIVDSVSCIDNLSGMVFTNSSGCQAKAPTSLRNKNRPKYLSFIRLVCTINGLGI